MIKTIEEKVIRGGDVSKEEALLIAGIPHHEIFSLLASANNMRTFFKGNKAGLCSIINAKSGACSEDCSYCAQSARSKAAVEVYPLLSKEAVLAKASEALESGAKRFSIVTSGRNTTQQILPYIAEMIAGISSMGLIPCASLGFLTEENLILLKKAGLNRYHHNLETSEAFFPEICTTHTYRDKIATIKSAMAAGLSVCSGGIFGMGETWEDRIDMAFALKELDIASVPVNFLVPIKGTLLEKQPLLHPFEALKIISLLRFILPQKEIRICGGRIQVLDEFSSLIFAAGADGLMTGNYLTTPGRKPGDDMSLIKAYGLKVG